MRGLRGLGGLGGLLGFLGLLGLLRFLGFIGFRVYRELSVSEGHGTRLDLGLASKNIAKQNGSDEGRAASRCSVWLYDRGSDPAYTSCMIR